ncbi:MAG: toll/interleukin-1 receptor domain-containing protein [Cyanobacteria bacterium P01_A01_bin.37]
MTNSPATQTYYPSLITVFISCSRQDEALLKALDVHLANLKRQGTISAWTDQVIKAGTEWEQEIQQKLAAAQLILLLISPDYIASDLCYCEQMQAALKRHEEGTARVIPIILRPTDMTGSPFSTLTPLPTDAKPITQWRDRDEAFLDVVKGIRRAITSLHLSTPSTPPSPAIQSPIPNPQSPIDSSRFTPSIYTPTTWVERTHITTKLLHILQGNCRILALVGITGIGKTALAERLVAQLTNTSNIPVGAHSRAPIQDALQSDTKPFRRLNLDDGGMTPEFASSGAALLRSLGHEPTVDDQKDPQNLLNHILTVITQRPCRLQIDSMERLLRGNDQEGWSEFCDPLWLELFQRLLTASDCQSQIILTTQDIPENLAYEGSRYDALWHCEPIRGLDEAEQLEFVCKTRRWHRTDPPCTPY